MNALYKLVQRTAIRASAEYRLEAETNQTFIEGAIVALGGTVPEYNEALAQADDDAFALEIAQH